MTEGPSVQLLVAQPWLPGRAGFLPASKKRPAAAAESSTQSSEAAHPCGAADAMSSPLVHPGAKHKGLYLGPGQATIPKPLPLCTAIHAFSKVKVNVSKVRATSRGQN